MNTVTPTSLDIHYPKERSMTGDPPPWYNYNRPLHNCCPCAPTPHWSHSELAIGIGERLSRIEAKQEELKSALADILQCINTMKKCDD